MTTAEQITIGLAFAGIIFTILGSASGVWWKLAVGETKLDNIASAVERNRQEVKAEHVLLWETLHEQSGRLDHNTADVARIQGQLSKTGR